MENSITKPFFNIYAMHEKYMKKQHRNSPREALHLRDENKQGRRNKVPNVRCMELIHSEKMWKTFLHISQISREIIALVKITGIYR